MQHTGEFAAAADALAGVGWCELSSFLPAAMQDALRRECAALDAAQAFRPARVGLERTATRLRTDRTHWFEPGHLTSPQRAFVARLDTLRMALNRQLLLGLIDGEAHYAMYPPGGGYARHRDCLHASDARVISAVYYLNAHWDAADGGALRLYLPANAHHDILPQGGKLVLFLSAQFEHEVLATSRTRMSIACWLRQQALPV